MKPQLKTPISYYGGKQRLLQTILPLVPEHKIYIEPFFGGGALYRAKKPAESEIINDVNMNVVNFYDVLKTNYKKLHYLIEKTLHSRTVYKKALIIYDSPRLFDDNPLVRAWAFFIVTNQGFACKVGSRGFGKESESPKRFQNKIENFKEEMAERLRFTQIEQNDAYKVIQSRDSANAFIYADPPYVNTHQGHYGGYSEEHFKRDLDVLATVKGKFLLSNYPGPIVLDFIKKHKWYVRTVDKPLSAGNRGKAESKRKTEILVANYPI